MRMIEYISTRGPGAPQSFEHVLLSGMAPDGGLYIPESWPQIDPAMLSTLGGRPYAEIAWHMLQQFAGGLLGASELQDITREAYAPKTFDHTAVAPLTQLSPDVWLLELFHGPTLSFKDYALQVLGRLFDRVLEQSGRRMTIVGATSGDTGSAAIEACKGCRNLDIFILHPKGRTSEVQRRQMTSVGAPNVFNIALEGTFDDCQAAVKTLFADQAMRDKYNLSAINSINWARIVGQMAYYIAASVALGAPGRPVSFAVPTGNFGNIYAAWAVRRMGLPVGGLTIASNRNDILTRFFETGTMKLEKVSPSLTPSMDIQISSNFERYLCEVLGRDHDALRGMMEQFGARKSFTVSPAQHRAVLSDFSARRCSDEETLQSMRSCYQETGILIDPHTAVGLHAAKAVRKDASGPSGPTVVLACAHPAKFPEAVRKATGIEPPVPPRLAAVMNKAEHLIALPNDIERVKSFIRANARA